MCCYEKGSMEKGRGVSDTPLNPVSMVTFIAVFSQSVSVCLCAMGEEEAGESCYICVLPESEQISFHHDSICSEIQAGLEDSITEGTGRPGVDGALLPHRLYRLAVIFSSCAAAAAIFQQPAVGCGVLAVYCKRKEVSVWTGKSAHFPGQQSPASVLGEAEA
ncbi:Hypothetical predicted protein [Podarcis lilfordi]|uniref:Uncharacterized protein n=1 Tax=Podarcis lilfordi TaxID=74358 RepID=A0AA35NYQ1_9SAUR|nr:Hypothetical predicted protein [Podarcis lilfordi]